MFISLSLVSFCRTSLKLDHQQYTTQDGEKQDVGEEIDHVLRYVLSYSSPTLRTLPHLSTHKRIQKTFINAYLLKYRPIADYNK